MFKKGQIKIKAIFILSILFVLINMSITFASNRKDIYDDNNRLSNEAESYILDKNNYIEDNLDIRIVLALTMKDTDREVEEYANEIFNNLTVKKDSDGGTILIVISITRNIKIIVKSSSSIATVLTQQEVEVIKNKYIKRDKLEKGILDAYNVVHKTICDYYGIKADVIVENNNVNRWIFVVCASIFIIMEVMLQGFARNHRRREYRKYFRNR